MEIDTVGSFHFDNCLAGEDGRRHGYAMPGCDGQSSERTLRNEWDRM